MQQIGVGTGGGGAGRGESVEVYGDIVQE